MGASGGPSSDGTGSDGTRTFAATFTTYAWRDPALIFVALLALASGFGQFGAVAALGSVAKAFGHQSAGATFADEAGLSGTVLGTGLAIIRAASFLGLPLASLADRLGRRPMLGATCTAGLVLTVLTVLSPSYWWFVGIFALGRPFLSATVGLSQVSAVELTASSDRAKAVSLMAAGYAVGAGLAAIVHSMAQNALGFRGIFALAVVPLVFMPYMYRRIVEPDRFARDAPSARAREPVLGPVARPFRRRLLVVLLLAFFVSVVTGPANSLVFVYVQSFLHLSGVVTSGMVVAAGAAGLGGLVLGRWLSDHLGRRPTIAIAMAGMSLFATLAYSGSDWALVAGYVLGVTSGAVFAPAAGSLANELFPTSVRASVTGWYIAAGVAGAVGGLLAFGAVADVHAASHHLGLAAAVVFLPVLAAIAFLLLLPETKGREPEDLWTGDPGTGDPGTGENRHAAGAEDALAWRSSRERVHPDPYPAREHRHAQPQASLEDRADEHPEATDPLRADPPTA